MTRSAAKNVSRKNEIKYCVMKILKFLLILLPIFGLTLPIISQEEQIDPNPFVDSQNDPELEAKIKNSLGREFWLCFMQNYKDPKPDRPSKGNELQLELFLTSNFDSKATVEIDGIDFFKEVFIPAGKVVNVKIDPAAQIRSKETVERLGVHILADNPISVYGLNRRFQTTDTYLGMPVNTLGKEYRVMCYEVSDGLMPEFAVVATENNTVVEILPTVDTEKHKGGQIYTIHLNKGDAYQVTAKNAPLQSNDLTGTIVSASKNVAVFSGHQCAYVPSKIIACNHLVEQVPPLHSWGKHFYLGRLMPRSKYTYRVLASENITKVFEDTRVLKILEAGEFIERNVDRNIQIFADKPILVAQYSQGFRNGDSIGDPMMVLVSPTQQFLDKYRFATPVNGSWEHYVNIVTPTKSIFSMRLNDKPIDSTQFERLGISRYSIAHIQIEYGAHTIEGDLPFGMYSYGFGFKKDAFDAYGTMGGQNFEEYEPLKDTIPPEVQGEYKITQGTPARGLGELDFSGRFSIIVREDRPDDTGIKDVRVIDAMNLRSIVPKINEGVAQTALRVLPVDPGMEAKDMALNSVIFTICYVQDPETGEFRMQMFDGDQEMCDYDPGVFLGTYVKPSVFLHNPDFINSGVVTANGEFEGTVGTGGWFGFYAGRRFFPEWTFSSRLSFESIGGTIEAPDSSVSKIRDRNNELIDFQESKVVKINGWRANLSIAAEWNFDRYLYLLGGLNLSVSLSDAISYDRRILIPENYVYSNGESEISAGSQNMESFKTIVPGLLLGAEREVAETRGQATRGDLPFRAVAQA